MVDSIPRNHAVIDILGYDLAHCPCQLKAKWIEQLWIRLNTYDLLPTFGALFYVEMKAILILVFSLTGLQGNEQNPKLYKRDETWQDVDGGKEAWFLSGGC